MSNKAIIDRAACIVGYKLEDIDVRNVDRVEITESELVSISTALAIAGSMCR